MKISPWHRPAGATRITWYLACALWALLGGIVFGGISLAIAGLLKLVFRVL